MHKFFLIVLLAITVECSSQTDTNSLKKNSRQKIIINDSVLTRLQQFDDSVTEDIRKKKELKEKEQRANSSADYFVRMQKERRAKEKRTAIMRIGIGIAFLIVLVFGLRRRIKKQ